MAARSPLQPPCFLDTHAAEQSIQFRLGAGTAFSPSGKNIAVIVATEQGELLATRDPECGTHLYSINDDGSKLRRMGERWPKERNIQFQDQILSMLRDDPQHVLIQIRNQYGVSVYKMNVDNGNLDRVVKHQDGISNWKALRSKWACHPGPVNAFLKLPAR